MTHSPLTTLPPLSLYIHIPWCVRKCPYCDFNSHESSIIPEAEYVKALVDDLEQDLAFVQDRKLHSIFFGGGTPSLFSAKSIEDILGAVEKRIAFSNEIEITLEANPGTAEQRKFKGYKTAGINRLSIGIQSFNSGHLKNLGRIHNSEEAVNAVKMARSAGFSNFNIDLMHGLPQQTQQQALADLKQAFSLDPSHISWYQLTIEPNTAFYSSPPILPSEDNLADIQQAGESLLSEMDYTQYETSAYSKHSRQSKHNRNYWLFGDYIGIGAGAHGKITTLSNQTITRHWKNRQPKSYLSPAIKYTSGKRTLSVSELPLEFMMNALRLNEGFEIETFTARTGLSYSCIEPQINKLVEKELLAIKDQRVFPTTRGKLFLNEILTFF